LKEFKIFGGFTVNNMTELLHSGLRNDNEAETFSLKHKFNDVVFPCNYIKIVPLMAWGANFNFSIWYVEIRGIENPEVVGYSYQEYINYRERETIRLCLKHFRQRNLMEAFYALQSKTNISLENQMLTELHELLVVRGDFDAVESLLKKAEDQNIFQEFISDSVYRPMWKKILAKDINGESPCMRGGHQMCIDDDNGLIYLLGGWDGSKDLADFWVYNINEGLWTLISFDTQRQGGPGPRSCHKISYDPLYRQIYVLGRYIDPQTRPGINCDADFFRYDTIHNKWYKLCDNTGAKGGPELIYDHQTVLDSENQIMYVFGGRIISPTSSTSPPENTYSGLYSYDIKNDSWKLIRSDQNQPEGTVHMKSRIGHSVLFNHLTRELYIFAGQRHKDYLSDYYIYNIDKDEVIEMNRDSSRSGGPDAGFTQRATIDVELGEFYIFSGLMREKNSTTEMVKNGFWVYNIKNEKWQKVSGNDSNTEGYSKLMNESEPCPRFAHQLVYDRNKKIQYLFGGNPGEPNNQSFRLDDFWELKLVK
jgi:hypothetical protein